MQRGPVSLLSAGYKSAAQARFEAEIAQEREARANRRALRFAVILGVALGVVGAFVVLL